MRGGQDTAEEELKEGEGALGSKEEGDEEGVEAERAEEEVAAETRE